MKMRGLLAVLFVFAGWMINAQDWSTDKYQYNEIYEGYIITKEGERIDGFIKYRNRYVMQEEVIFYKSKSNPSSKKKYMADDLMEYKVADKTYHCINYSGGASVSKIRANLLINGEGCIKEYRWYERASGYNTLTRREGETDDEFLDRKFPPTTVYFKDGDEMAVTKDFFKDDFTKKMAAYVKDYKELYKKVKGGEKGYDKLFNLEAIFKEYNEWCK